MRRRVGLGLALQMPPPQTRIPRTEFLDKTIPVISETQSIHTLPSPMVHDDFLTELSEGVNTALPVRETISNIVPQWMRTYFVVSSDDIIKIVDNVMKGVKEGKSRTEIISQIDVLFDYETLEAIEEARRDHDKGRTRVYGSLDDLKKGLS